MAPIVVPLESPSSVVVGLFFKDGPCSIELLKKKNSGDLMVQHHFRQLDALVCFAAHACMVTKGTTNGEYQSIGGPESGVLNQFGQPLRRDGASPLVENDQSISISQLACDSLGFFELRLNQVCPSFWLVFVLFKWGVSVQSLDVVFRSCVGPVTAAFACVVQV